MRHVLCVQGVPFFGAAVSADDFAPEELSAHSSYYRGPVQRRAIPTATLAVLAIALLLIFIGWWVSYAKSTFSNGSQGRVSSKRQELKASKP